MGLFSWLFGGKGNSKQHRHRADAMAQIPGTGEYRLAIVGEGSYQDALSFVCGGKTADGHDLICEAVVHFEDSNPYDKNAIRVDIQGTTVGYLSRQHALQFRKRWQQENLPKVPVKCGARICGGWDRGNGDEGHFGVYLDVPVNG